MKYYELHLQNPDFYIAKKTVDGLILSLLKIDPLLKYSRGKIQNGHVIYFDSEVEDSKIFRVEIEDYLERNKYDKHEYNLMVMGQSKVGKPEDIKVLQETIITKFEDFESLYEDTLLHYEAWEKPIIVSIDNDDQGGYVTLKIDGRQVAKKYVALKNEIEAWKKKATSGYLGESTTNYWPGYGDDGTADSLGHIRDKTSKIHNKELEKAEKEVMGVKTSLESPEANKFFQKWMYANMITTSLQDGFYLKPELVEKSLELYKELIEEDVDSMFGESTGAEKFKKTIPIIIEELKKEIKEGPIKEGPTYDSTGEYYYAPGFLDQRQEARKNNPELE